MKTHQHVDQSKRQSHIGARIRWFLFASVITSIAVLVLVAVINVPHEKLPGVLAVSRQAASIGTLVQAFIAMWIIMRWRRVVAWCRVKGVLRKSEHRKALQLRAKAAGILALYLLLIPIGPMALVRTTLSLFH